MPTTDLFRVHLENTRALDSAFSLIAKECRAAIARHDDATVDSLTKTCGFLLGARMENRLYRLLYEPGAFDTGQRQRIAGAGSIEASWQRMLVEAYAARRQLLPRQVPKQLNFTDKARYEELRRLVQDELAPLITLRNVLGHGQWHRALNAERTAISTQRMEMLNTTRLWHLNIKANLLDQLVLLVHDLAVTANAFERDFDKRWIRLQAAKRRLELNRYQAWEDALVRQRRNSIARRPPSSERAS